MLHMMMQCAAAAHLPPYGSMAQHRAGVWPTIDRAAFYHSAEPVGGMMGGGARSPPHTT